MQKQIDQKIDAVVAWVDGNDPAHQAARAAALSAMGEQPEGAKEARFVEFDEVSSCVHSVLKFGSFFNHIYIVTDNQVPERLLSGLEANHPDLRKRISIVDHHEIYRGYEDFLPVFNSLSIETMLFRIPGLSERFVYFNDDMFLSNPTRVEDFFQGDKPVLRGHWFGRGYLGFTALTDIKRKLSGRPRRFETLGFKPSQFHAAKLVGFSRRAYCVTHSAYPMRKSVFESFYAENPQLLAANAAPKFRTPTQYNPAALANHIEIRNQNAVLMSTRENIYMSPLKNSEQRIRTKIYQIDSDPRRKLACIQDLYLAPENTRAEIVSWMNERLAL